MNTCPLFINCIHIFKCERSDMVINTRNALLIIREGGFLVLRGENECDSVYGVYAEKLGHLRSTKTPDSIMDETRAAWFIDSISTRAARVHMLTDLPVRFLNIRDQTVYILAKPGHQDWELRRLSDSVVHSRE